MANMERFANPYKERLDKKDKQEEVTEEVKVQQEELLQEEVQEDPQTQEEVELRRTNI